jgi:hypothetical protein
MTFPENWTAPRELARALPRETSITGIGIFIAILAALALLGSIPLFVAFRGVNVRDKAWADALRTQGRETAGQIVRLWRTSGKSSRSMVTYAFSANGNRLHGDATVPGDIWRNLRTNSALPVRYLPSDPTVNHPAAWELPTEPAWVPVLLPALVAGVGMMLLLLVRRQAQVAAEGVPAAGMVTKCFAVKGGWTVRYQFRMKDGAIAGGSGQATRRLDLGTVVCVLYLPQNPKRNAMYPLTFYRVTQ